MRQSIKTAVLAFAAVGLLGCGRLSNESEELQPQMRENDVLLRVVNQNFYDARLFARWRNGRRVSIGQVTGFDEETFVFRWEHFDLRVEINLLSVGVHYTPWMHVEHGDELDLVIDPSLDKRIRIRRP